MGIRTMVREPLVYIFLCTCHSISLDAYDILKKNAYDISSFCHQVGQKLKFYQLFILNWDATLLNYSKKLICLKIEVHHPEHPFSWL